MIFIEPLDLSQVKWFRRQLKAWAKQHLRDFPWRRTKDPYAIFVAFLLQKTNAALVAPIYQAFIERYPTLHNLAAAPVEEVTSFFYWCGFLLEPSDCASQCNLSSNRMQETSPIAKPSCSCFRESASTRRGLSVPMPLDSLSPYSIPTLPGFWSAFLDCRAVG